MSDLPRLELREDLTLNKKNDYIIFRYPLKSNEVKKLKQTKNTTRKNVYKKKHTVKRKHRKHKKHKKHSTKRKSFFSIL